MKQHTRTLNGDCPACIDAGHTRPDALGRPGTGCLMAGSHVRGDRSGMSSIRGMEDLNEEIAGPRNLGDRFCPTCQAFRRTYVEEQDGNSAPRGSTCCAHCQRVLLPPPATPANSGAEGFESLRGIAEIRALIGQTLVLITHDVDGKDWKACLHFSNGTTLVFPIGPEGFDVSPI
jgi:hypothetical protein